MPLTIPDLLAQLRSAPQSIDFTAVLDTIDAHFTYTPARFTNGRGDDKVINAAGQNEGSCRLFAFALLQGLSPQETLALFGDYYRTDVLGHPDASDHANIRTFMRHGWAGIHYDTPALHPKA